ncbi:MAG: hypothetical protein EOP83_34525 [Verrucomicrobiaceae bacterium]|nr:MAG: hypothetical protein EOP83_34525 [Verrucomicrobiaceae bacterium]
MATDIIVNIDAYRHLDNTYDADHLGRVEVSINDRRDNPYVVFKLPRSSDDFAVSLDDLKRAIKALED